MAFCPNCGTPNTDQAEKCVSCGFELATKQKNKFKGTMMMSGIKVPGQPQPNQPAAAPPPAAGTPPDVAPAGAAPEAPSAPAGDRNMAFQRTMVGHAGMVPPASAKPLPEPRGAAAGDFAHAPTIQGSGPSPSDVAKGAAAGQTPPSVHAQGAVSAGSRSATPGFSASASSSGTDDFGDARHRASTGDVIDSSFPGGVSKPNPGKILAIGCAALLVLCCVVSGILWATLGAKLKSMMSGGDTGAEAAAWQASIAQSLAQVAALCQNDCQQASVFFHPNSQAALLDEGKALTEARIQKLSDPESSKAEMLDGTEDDDIATKLGLDPQQCARVVAGAAKVVSCSVPEPGGKPSVLRIVHLSGVQSL